MRAGELRDRVVIQKTSGTHDSGGRPIKATWSTYKTLWSDVTYLSGRDLLSAQAINSKVTARIKLRARDDITSGMRVVHRGTTFTIDSPPLYDNESGREYMTFMLSSV